MTRYLPHTNTLPHGYVPLTEPREKQWEGIAKLLTNKNFAVFDEVGVGKTLQVIYAALDLMKGNRIDCAIIPIKAAHAGTWYDEDDCQLLTHAPEATWHTIIGKSPSQRSQPWPMDRDFYFINYELMSRMLAKGRKYGHADATIGKTRLLGQDIVHLLELLKERRCLICPDEIHAIKNPTSNVSKVMHAIAPLAVRRWGMTGSPMAERPDDIWSVMYFLDQGETLGKNYWKFIEKYANFAESRDGKRWVTGYKNLDKLRKKVSKVSIRRLIDDCHDLPEFVPKTYSLRPSGVQAKLIKDAAKRLLKVIGPMSRQQLAAAMRSEHGAYTLAMLEMLRATCTPSILDKKAGPGVKLQDVCDLIEELGGKQLVVWVVHKDVGNAAVTYIKATVDSTCALINGDVPPLERKKIITAFKAGTIKTLVATAKILGESATLVNCSDCYFLEFVAEAKPFEQAIGRFRRPGQKNKVVYSVAMVRGSMDKYSWKVIKHKLSVKTRGLDKKTKIFDKEKMTDYLREECGV